MKLYLADTNLYLRFLLQDNIEQANEAKEYFGRAKKGQIKIIFLSVIINEIAVILTRYYQFTHSEILEKLQILIKSPYLQVEDKNLWLQALNIFGHKKIDLLDIFLFLKAKDSGGEVLSFDKDFKKLLKGGEDS